MNYPQISKELIMNLEELDIYLRHINIFEKSKEKQAFQSTIFLAQIKI